MYNEERKLEYIKIAMQSNVHNEQIYRKRFAQSEKFERELDKDICEWSVNEIINFYQSQLFNSLEFLLIVHSAYNRYASWCLANLMISDSQNHFTEINREILNAKCINNAYLQRGITTREELLGLLETDYIRNHFEKFLALGLFEGIGGKHLAEFQQLTMDDFHENTLILPNRTLQVSDELIHYAQLASTEYIYYSYSDGHADSSFNEHDNRILKTKPGASDLQGYGWNHKINTIMRRVSRNNEDSPVYNVSNLAESGRLEMLRDFMRKDGTDGVTTIKKHDDEIAYRYGRIHGRERYCDKWKNFLN